MSKDLSKDYRRLLLDQLIDRYERSSSFRTGEEAARRIMLKLYDNGRTDFPLYDIEKSEQRMEINQAVVELEKLALISFQWMKGEEEHIIAKVWLNLQSLSETYAFLGRVPKANEIETVCLQLTHAIEKADAEWAKNYLQETRDTISAKRKIGNRLPESAEEREKLLKCICFASKSRQTYLLERAFSLQCCGDSKQFEKIVRSRLIKILRDYLGADADAADEELLRQIGITKYPEQLEFCGSVILTNKQTRIDFSNLQYGSAIFHDELKEGAFDIPNTVRCVLSIENRANYIDYIYHHKKEDELVVYHGGQYSPSKRHFFQMISLAMPQTAEWFHWGDIDYGGFSMLLRLRQEIRSDVKAYRMGVHELTQYQNLCVIFDDGYAKKLEKLLQHTELQDCHDCIRFMLNKKHRLEQEAFLTSDDDF